MTMPAVDTLPIRERNAQIDDDLARWVSRLLRTSIIISGALILIGLVLWATGHSDIESVDQALGKDESTLAVSPSTIYHGIKDGIASAYIELGILVLLVTPTIRVVLTGLSLARQKAWILVGASGIILTILLLGLFGIIGE